MSLQVIITRTVGESTLVGNTKKIENAKPASNYKMKQNTRNPDSGINNPAKSSSEIAKYTSNLMTKWFTSTKEKGKCPFK